MYPTASTQLWVGIRVCVAPDEAWRHARVLHLGSSSGADLVHTCGPCVWYPAQLVHNLHRYVTCHRELHMHADELRESVGSPVRKTQVIEGFGNACSEAETTAKNIKKKTKAEPVFVVVTGDPDPMHDIPCPPAAEKQYQCAPPDALGGVERKNSAVLVQGPNSSATMYC